MVATLALEAKLAATGEKAMAPGGSKEVGW